jgi:hypothetical protein
MGSSVPNGAYTRTNSFGAEGAKVVPRFFTDSVLDELASEREGRPIFKERELIEFLMPANREAKPHFLVTNEHRQMFPEQYKKFKEGQDQSVSGFPIEQWAALKRNMVLELKALGFTTVEQLAEMGDLAIQRIGMGGRSLKTLAISFLDDQAGMAEQARVLAENDRRATENAELNRKVDELTNLCKSLSDRLMAFQNAPNPIAGTAPMSMDPMEQMRALQQPQHAAASSLDSLAAAPRRGRPPKPRDEHGNIIAEAP